MNPVPRVQVVLAVESVTGVDINNVHPPPWQNPTHNRNPALPRNPPQSLFIAAQKLQAWPTLPTPFPPTLREMMGLNPSPSIHSFTLLLTSLIPAPGSHIRVLRFPFLSQMALSKNLTWPSPTTKMILLGRDLSSVPSSPSPPTPPLLPPPSAQRKPGGTILTDLTQLTIHSIGLLKERRALIIFYPFTIECTRQLTMVRVTM